MNLMGSIFQTRLAFPVYLFWEGPSISIFKLMRLMATSSYHLKIYLINNFMPNLFYKVLSVVNFCL